jgi:hypothetical protein
MNDTPLVICCIAMTIGGVLAWLRWHRQPAIYVAACAVIVSVCGFPLGLYYSMNESWSYGTGVWGVILAVDVLCLMTVWFANRVLRT